DLALAIRPPEVDDALWKARVMRGAVVLILDGLTDLPGGQEGLGADLVGRLISGRQPFPVLVTSRRVHAPEHGGRVARCDLPPWRRSTILQYLESRSLPVGATLGQFNVAGLEGLVSNPVWLDLAVRLLNAGVALPRTRAGLLVRAAKAPLGEGAGEREARCLQRLLGRFHIALSACGSALPDLAWALDGPPHFCADWVGLHSSPDGAAVAVIQGALTHNRPDLLIDVVVANHGVLADQVRTECWNAAGRGLLAARPVRSLTLAAVLGLPDSVLRQALSGGVLDAVEQQDLAVYRAVRSALLAHTLTEGRLHELHADLHVDVHADLHADFTESVAELAAPPDLDPLAGAIFQLRQATGSYRRAAANALGHIGDQGALDALAKTLEPGVEKEPKVRGSATNALGQIGDRRAVPVLVRVLTGHFEPEARVRASAATALGRIGDRGAVPALASALLVSAEVEARVRGAAANALGLLGDARATEALCGILAAGVEPDPRVRASAATALGRIGDPAAVRALALVLEPGAEDDGNVRASAVHAIGELRDSEGMAALAPVLDVAVERDAFVRASAANALGLIADRGAVLPLNRVLESGFEPDAVVRGAAASALGQLGDGNSVGALVGLLQPSKERDAVVRARVIKALGLIRDRTTVPALIGVLEAGVETDAFVRGAGADALGRIGDCRAVPALIRALDPSANPEPDLRLCAVIALANIGDRGALPGLMKALEPGVESDPSVRRALADAVRSLSTSPMGKPGRSG
ncbi:MAG: HEAT repeat domain-containing protein, partial [Myxococcales bacterium]|nr:HEAT repeat domain-containing protein [Myxococcales bacterium]